MLYHKIIRLENGTECCIRNADEDDGKLVLENFYATHSQTDYLCTYPDENNLDAAQEGQILREKAESKKEIELVAVIDGMIVGTAGIGAVDTRYKLRHRAEFGISVLREFWGLGIGRALMGVCIECARAAGYSQLELEVVSGNERALSLYRGAGFVEYGRNPRGFCSRLSGFQEVVYMRLELDGGG